jgi:predicted phage tail protein
MSEIEILQPIRGSGGGGGGKKGGSGKNDANSLRSRARARIVELLGEGEIGGLVNGDKSIYFDATPVRNENGSLNFDGVVYEERKGLPDQMHITGFSTVETPITVDTEVKNDQTPPVRTVMEQNADAVRVIIRIPALLTQNDKGELKGNSVEYAIDVRSFNGDWVETHHQSINNEKTTSAFQLAHRIPLPFNGHPWDVRVRRLTPDSDDDKSANETWWESYTVLVEGKFTYPNSAFVAMELDSEEFGQNIPSRSYHVYGLLIQVPVNYDPIARTYTGIWDGSFKKAWTNNPAWIFYDMLTNDRYGLGDFIDASKVDKWTLYQIGQYCDQEVPSGYKDSEGNSTFEPRFTFNTTINTRQEAYKVLQQITSAWRGMGFWSLGQVFAMSDMPTDPRKLVTQADVVGGHFNYSGTSEKARHSVALITWNDPSDHYRPAIEVVINDKMLQRYGWRETSIEAPGCTSRGLAHRYGKWILDTEQHETETVEYEASWDHADMKPGDVIAVADIAKAGVRTGGRIRKVEGSVVYLDGKFEPAENEDYWLMVETNETELERKSILSFAQDENDRTVVTLSEPFEHEVKVNALWVITGTDIAPRTFRVLAITETEKNRFKVNALFHDPNKFARVEEGIIFDPLPYTRPKLTVNSPRNLAALENQYFLDGVPKSRILLSWSQPDDFMAVRYRVAMNTPSGAQDLGVVSSLSIDIENVVAGDYTFSVRAMAATGIMSEPVILEFTAQGWGGTAPPWITNFGLIDHPGELTFTGRNVSLSWRNNFAQSSDATVISDESGYSTFYRENEVKVYDVGSGDLLRTVVMRSDQFFYSYEQNKADNEVFGRGPQRQLRFTVIVRDIYGRTSEPAELVVNNDPPAAVNPTIRINANMLFMTWPTPDDVDYLGSVIWISEDELFDPLTTEPIYDGMGTSIAYSAEPNTSYFVRLGVYDTFGKEGMSISPTVQVDTTAFTIDLDPPSTPENLVLTPELDDTLKSRIIATWNADVESDVAYYAVEIRKQDGQFVGFQTNTNRFEWDVNPNTAYEVRVRAFDIANNSSPFTAVVSVLSVGDSVAPNAPVNLTAKSSFKTIWLSWSKNTETDFSRYEIFVSENDTAPLDSLETSEAIYVASSNVFPFSNLN